MSLPLTPAILEAAYDFLRTWPPFRQCKLPPSEQVEFHVTNSKKTYGQYSADHAIYISATNNGLSDTMLRTMAHEMIHQALRIKGDPKYWQHGAKFKAHARRVCKCAGWDLKAF